MKVYILTCRILDKTVNLERVVYFRINGWSVDYLSIMYIDAELPI